ncbi:fasciclin domain-containing protein [Flavihumibacter fluvii]|nr:fasciclin domain-containing protein [Flavihumibacter fluvii]
MVQPEEPKDIVDIVVRSEDHTTLAAALKAAALIDTLKNAGPFTVFAPTNKAFNTLPAGKVDGLLKPEKKAELTKILTYHVVPGNIIAADLKNGQKLTTLEGQVLTVSIKAGKIKINRANIITADLAGKNGVIHVIDAVLIPKK